MVEEVLHVVERLAREIAGAPPRDLGGGLGLASRQVQRGARRERERLVFEARKEPHRFLAATLSDAQAGQPCERLGMQDALC
jgi:hypothetical protein